MPLLFLPDLLSNLKGAFFGVWKLQVSHLSVRRLLGLGVARGGGGFTVSEHRGVFVSHFSGSIPITDSWRVTESISLSLLKYTRLLRGASCKLHAAGPIPAKYSPIITPVTRNSDNFRNQRIYSHGDQSYSTSK